MSDCLILFYFFLQSHMLHEDVNVTVERCFTCTADWKLSSGILPAGRPMITVILRCHIYLNKMIQTQKVVFLC